MRLTYDLIQNAPAFLNPLLERELDLRGYNIPTIENLGATMNQFDTLNLCDNDIQKLENFPALPRVKSLLLTHNRISKVADGLGEKLPTLDMLILTRNKIGSLAEIEGIAQFRKLTVLSLLENPVTRKQHYRRFVVHKCPKLKVLDFVKIKRKEREDADSFFQTKEGKTLEATVAKVRALTPGKLMSGESGAAGGGSGHGSLSGSFSARSKFTPAQVTKIQKLIADASTPEQVEALEKALKDGVVPDSLDALEAKSANVDKADEQPPGATG